MKTSIIYFSVTGNTRKVAEAVREGFKKEGWETELISICDYKGAEDFKNIASSDLIGIGVPVYYFRLPLNIRPYVMEYLPDISGKPVFLFFTYGGDPGKAMEELSDLVHRKGSPVIGALLIPAFDTFPFYLEYKIGSGRPDLADLKLTEEFTRFLAFKAARKERSEKWDISEKLKCGAFAEGTQRAVTAFIEKMLAGFWSDRIINRVAPLYFTENCTACGVCAKLCPRHRIRMKPRPAFVGRCSKCFKCFYCCPRRGLGFKYNWFSRLVIAVERLIAVLRFYPDYYQHQHFYL